VRTRIPAHWSTQQRIPKACRPTALGYADGDPNASKTPQIVAAGYTYNKENEKLTTNFAIDAAAGALVRQGSVEGEQPVVSPNTGKLRTVGSLGVAGITDAHFDIADLNNAAFAWISTAQGGSTTHSST
jgi:hypothetical protein